MDAGGRSGERFCRRPDLKGHRNIGAFTGKSAWPEGNFSTRIPTLGLK
jgi:hypothetical protein